MEEYIAEAHTLTLFWYTVHYTSTLRWSMYPRYIPNWKKLFEDKLHVKLEKYEFHPSTVKFLGYILGSTRRLHTYAVPDHPHLCTLNNVINSGHTGITQTQKKKMVENKFCQVIERCIKLCSVLCPKTNLLSATQWFIATSSHSWITLFFYCWSYYWSAPITDLPNSQGHATILEITNLLSKASFLSPSYPHHLKLHKSCF